MDTLDHYRHIIKQALTEYQTWASRAALPGIEDCLAFGLVKNKFIVLHQV